MPFIVWNKSICVNVNEIDEQHKKLIGLLNQVYDSMNIGQGKIIFDNILRELTDYTEYHFSAEEKYMIKFEYPEYEYHKSEHEYFKNKVSELNLGYKTNKMNLVSDMLDFLKDWFINHIKKNDMKYSSFFSEKGLV